MADVDDEPMHRSHSLTCPSAAPAEHSANGACCTVKTAVIDEADVCIVNIWWLWLGGMIRGLFDGSVANIDVDATRRKSEIHAASKMASSCARKRDIGASLKLCGLFFWCRSDRRVSMMWRVLSSSRMSRTWLPCAVVQKRAVNGWIAKGVDFPKAVLVSRAGAQRVEDTSDGGRTCHVLHGKASRQAGGLLSRTHHGVWVDVRTENHLHLI